MNVTAKLEALASAKVAPVGQNRAQLFLSRGVMIVGLQDIPNSTGMGSIRSSPPDRCGRIHGEGVLPHETPSVLSDSVFCPDNRVY